MVFTAVSRTQIHDADRSWIWKLCFRVAATVFSLIGIGCTAWAVSANNHLADTTQEAFWVMVWLLIPLGSSVIWNFINFIVLLARNKPIHPGANVGCDLLLWIAFVVTGVISSFGVYEDYKFEGSFRYYYSYSQYPGARSSEICPGFDSCDDAGGVLKHRGEVEAAGVAFAFAATILHFALFVAACIDVHRLNRSRDEKRAVKVAETIIAGMEKRGQLPYQQSRYQSTQHPIQQSSYLPSVQPTHQPTHQFTHQPAQFSTQQSPHQSSIHPTHQSPHQPTYQPILQPPHQQGRRSISPISPELTQVPPQRTTTSSDTIENHNSSQVLPERNVVRDEVDPKR
ncbi:MAG: hypothetical protein M1812_003231 [Candelaria pacifica]|nr:MAG: hypothetical protein M1812_003231 [Candelaria pacifica]